MESLIQEMLDGRILLAEAVGEFEKIYIQKALERNANHLSNTAEALGIHRNTLSSRLTFYNGAASSNSRMSKPRKRKSSSTRTKPASRTRKARTP